MLPQSHKSRSFDVSPQRANEQPKGFGPDIVLPEQQVVQAPTLPNAQTAQQHQYSTINPIAPQNNQDDIEYINSEKKRRKREELKNMIYTVGLFIFAPLFAVFMIVFVFQSYVVDGSSMEPTLQNGNRVFILKLPKTVSNLKGDKYVPSRNEIIVFKKPTNDGTQLIKRVIGLPGDRVVIQNGKITIYNLDNPSGFDPDAGTEYEGTLEPVDTQGEIVTENVGEGELFVLGDNRGPGGSLDSHSGLGLVPVENIVGRLWIRYFPLSEFQSFAIIYLKT